MAEKYSNGYDEIEKQSFLKWFKFYSNGEHKRYAGEKMKLRKKGSYNSGLVPNSNYQKKPSFNSEDENLSDDPIFRSKENTGNGGGINIGLTRVDTPYAIYFDIDTFFKKNFC